HVILVGPHMDGLRAVAPRHRERELLAHEDDAGRFGLGVDKMAAGAELLRRDLMIVVGIVVPAGGLAVDHIARPRLVLVKTALRYSRARGDAEGEDHWRRQHAAMLVPGIAGGGGEAA